MEIDPRLSYGWFVSANQSVLGVGSKRPDPTVGSTRFGATSTQLAHPKNEGSSYDDARKVHPAVGPTATSWLESFHRLGEDVMA